MPTSPSNQNPWRQFRCLLTGRCVSNPEERGRDLSQVQGALHRSSDHIRTDKHTGFQQRQNTAAIQKLQKAHCSFDDNGNANMSYTILSSGLRNVTTCDKQTQTALSQELSVRCDTCLRSVSNKIGVSRSCDNFTRKSRIYPNESRSFEIYNHANKESVEFDDIIEIVNNESPVKAFENRTHGISSNSKARNKDATKYEAEPNFSTITDNSNILSSIDSAADIETEHVEDESRETGLMLKPVDMKHFPEKTDAHQPFVANFERDVDDLTSEKNGEQYFRNQWSPFRANNDNDEVRQFYEYREADDVSLVSERSCYSTTSEEGDAYEVIDWNQYTVDYEKDEVDKQRRSNAYGTPLATPILDLSALDGYHTAPNSPTTANSEQRLNSHEKNTTEFCVVDASKGYVHNYVETNKAQCNDVDDFSVDQGNTPGHNIANNAHMNHYTKNLCCKCGKAAETGEVNSTENDHDSNERNGQLERRKLNNQTRMSDSRILQLELPPIISVNSIHYEADTDTGTAKVIGRGSFGHVYKARFSDPMFYHLPIVIKEFNEEFTNTREIIDEAKRLLYLQDTGYVPICYGLLCFGTPSEPKYGIVQEYVGTGLTLEQMLWDQYELPLEFWFRIVVQCCEGLARFHDKGILLNDIKTNNILIEFAEHSVRIRYIDFGLATDMRGKRYKNTKSLEEFVYLAPEVRQNGKITSVASDIYSLGYILKQINTFTGLHELNVVAQLCMDKDPNERLPVRSAANMIKDQMYKMGFDPLISWGL